MVDKQPEGETMADYWADVRPILREQSKERRGNNRVQSAQVLTEHGVSFESKNGGAHLVVTHGPHVIDFWPGTGQYAPRKTSKKGRGVFNLLRYLKITKTSPPPTTAK